MRQTHVEAKGYLKSKTNIIAILVMLAGVMQQVADAQLLPDQYQGYLLTAVGVIMFIMRMLTDKPVSSKPLAPETKAVSVDADG